MKHLLPIDTEQIIYIIPRVYATSVTLTLRDDSSNNVKTILLTGVKNGNYIKLTSVFELVEGRFYDLKVYNGQVALSAANIIYRDKIFCTAQSTNQSTNNKYSVNKNSYIQKSGNNDFIIL
tara:strand:+ start:104 stop:466 length:363 start_codon:yes stop_codon:yes gene_type:complete